ncbi:MAG: tandem-95 repeat protein, partial [Gammaproteobacteria bacterium]|nr:tandem-95 repeat protein [Gammaproteobacteria bacterium]
MQISQTIRTATGHSQFLLIVGFMLLLSTPVSAGGRIVVDPPVMAPVEATGVVTFSIIAEGIPEPGLGTFALDIEFIGDRVELIDGGIVSHTDTEDKVVCSARFADNNSLIAEPVTGGVKIQSNAGSMLRNSRANGSMLCVDNGPANGNRSSYLCGLYGDVEPQNGSGSLIDFVCVVGTEVPVGEALRIQPTLYSGLGESSVVYPYGSAMGVIDSFDGGVLFIPGAGNGQPDALDDQVETDEDSALHIPVLNNDSDPEQDSLHITEITEPANGSAILDGVGILYTPGPDYNGQDSFNYTISDGKGGADLATVTVTVTPVNDPPNAYDDSTRTPWDSTRSIAVLSNDVDIDGDPLQIIGVSDPESGSVSTDGETVSYTPVP